MNEQHYTVEALLLNQSFRKWVFEQDEKSNTFWKNWLSANPHQLDTVQQARQLLLNLPEVRYIYGQEREDKLWGKISEEIRKPQPVKGKVIPLHTIEKTKEHQRENGSWKPLLSARVAASLLLIVSLFLAYLWVNLGESPKKELRQWVVKENPYGQRSTIYLSDGTEVFLNAGSQLQYYEQFSKDKRVVRLKGEAFFEVAEDSSRVFEVISENIVTQALGTSFNVRSFVGEPIRVALLSGKVLVNDTSLSKQAGIILQPGESALYDKETPGVVHKDTFDKKLVLSWKEGILYFEEADEKTVFSTLERWYGVEIKSAQASPRPWEYTGEIANLSLEQVLQSLSYTMRFDYTLDNKQVNITYHE